MTNPEQVNLLTEAEHRKFASRRIAMTRGLVALFVLPVVLALNAKLLHFEIRGAAVAIIFAYAFGVGLWTMVQMFRFKCPRCGTTPMAKRLSFGGGVVESSSFVALSPKQCQKCGVKFSVDRR